jgi:hypothetical protein
MLPDAFSEPVIPEFHRALPHLILRIVRYAHCAVARHPAKVALNRGRDLLCY